MVYFAGAGGADCGIQSALGRSVDVAINHCELALSVNSRNHPNTRAMVSDVWEVDPSAALGGRLTEYIHYSPDCRHFSRARGSKPVEKNIRGLAWVVPDSLRVLQPTWFSCENVAELAQWGELMQKTDADGEPVFDAKGEPVMIPDPSDVGSIFRKWIASIEALGYTVEWRVLNAKDYGVASSRERLFVIGRRDGKAINWPEPSHGAGRVPYKASGECIDWSIPAHSIFLSKEQGRAVNVRRPLAENTLRRIAQGVKRFIIEDDDPYMVDLDGESAAVPYFVPRYGERSGQTPRCRSARDPLGTIVPTNNQGSLVFGALAKHFTGVVGHSLRTPMGTITSVDHHSLTRCDGVTQLDETTRERAVAVADFVREYAGIDVPEVIEVKGAILVDVSMRMLAPPELYLANGFSPDFCFTEGADGRKLTIKDQMRLVGNSVPPPVMEAICRANK